MTTREKLAKLLDQLTEAQLEAEYERLAKAAGGPMPNVVAALHRSRATH